MIKIEVDPNNQDLIYRLRIRAKIRRSISTRRSVQLGQADKIADLLEEAADEIQRLRLGTINPELGERGY